VTHPLVRFELLGDPSLDLFKSKHDEIFVNI
jgi:hypothetical protein